MQAITWIFFFAALTAHGATMDSALKEYGIRVASPIAVSKDLTLKGTSKNQHLIEASTPEGEHYSVKIIAPISAAAAQAWIESESAALRKLFQPAQTPYMGDIAQAVGGCPTRFGPMQSERSFLGHKVAVVLGSADASFAFGACTPELAKFKGAFWAYYDPTAQAAWLWRVFAPWNHSTSRLGEAWLDPLLSRFQR